MSLVIDKPDFSVEQVAKSPIEVLCNINFHWLQVCCMAPQANYPVADNLMTLLYAMEVYAETTHTCMEDVSVYLRPMGERGVFIELSVPELSPSWYAFTHTEEQFKAAKDELYARTCMREDVQRQLARFLGFLHVWAARDCLLIDDYESRDYPIWVGPDRLKMLLTTG